MVNLTKKSEMRNFGYLNNYMYKKALGINLKQKKREIFISSPDTRLIRIIHKTAERTSNL